MLKYYGKNLNGKPIAIIELINTVSGTKEICIEDKYSNIKQFNIANNTYYSEENVRTEWKLLKVIDEKPDGFRIPNKEYYEENNVSYYNRYFERYNSILFIDDYLNGKVYDDILNDKESDYYKALYNVLGDDLDFVLTMIGMKTFTRYNLKYFVYVNGMSNLGKDVFQNALSKIFSNKHFLSESYIDNDRDPDLHNKYIHVLNETSISSRDFERFNRYTGSGETDININQKGKNKDNANLEGYNCFVFNNDSDVIIHQNSKQDQINALLNRCFYIERQNDVVSLSEVLENRSLDTNKYAEWIIKYIYSKLNSMTDKDKNDFFKTYINKIKETNKNFKNKFVYKDTGVLFENFLSYISKVCIEEDDKNKIGILSELFESDIFASLVSSARTKGIKINFLDIFYPEHESSKGYISRKYKALNWETLRAMAKDFGYLNSLQSKLFFGDKKPGSRSCVIEKDIIECAMANIEFERKDNEVIVTMTDEKFYKQEIEEDVVFDNKNNSNSVFDMF